MTAGEYIGALGVFVLLFAFALNLSGRLNNSRPTYHLLNAVGAGLACYASWIIDFIPFVVLEASWLVVALIALFWQQRTKGDHRESIDEI